MSDELNFDDLAPIEIPVSVARKKYVLREASGGASVIWRDAVGRAVKIGPEGKPAGIDGMASTEPLLISQCLYVPDESGKIRLQPNGDPDQRYLVPIQTIRSWQARVQNKLFEKIKEISDLDNKETEKTLEEKMAKLKEQMATLHTNGDRAKNEQSAMADGSA